MAIAVVMEFAGGTLEQYDQVLEKLNFTPGGPGAPGGLFHWCADTGGAVRVTDVWQSREAFDAFAQERMLAALTELGIAPPELTFHDVHSYLTAGTSG